MKFRKPVPDGIAVSNPYMAPEAFSNWHFDQVRGLWIHGPGPNGERQHKGTDFAAPVGTIVTAMVDGMITRASYEDADNPKVGFGMRVRQLVMLPGYDSWEVVYAHLSAMYVIPGNKIRAGDRIGISGNTGRTTGPHLHVELVDRKAQYHQLEFDA